mmetsp:Transcript_15453/g.46371  ORF Transcript_15453/g.46371 Transcript_15453/m.46371 type:complete len:486 (-) Transcript_15453:162-1619(-)
MSPVPMDYFAEGRRPFLLQFPACISRIVTPGPENLENLENLGKQEQVVCGESEQPKSYIAPSGNDGCGRQQVREARTRSGYAGGGKASEPPRAPSHEAPKPLLPGRVLPEARAPRNSKKAEAPGERRPMKEILNLKKAPGATPRAPDPLHTAFNPKEIKPVDPDRFELLGKVEDAVRNCGKVLLMRDKEKDKLVAVKRMPNEWVRGSHSDFVKAYPSETELPWQDIGCNRFLNEVGYQYGCNLLGVYRSETHTDVVTDLASEGDMFRWCEKRLTVPPGPEREALVRPLARQMIEGVQQLHDMSIVHRDLSLENILMSTGLHDGDYNVQVIDFGMASTVRYFQRCVRGKASYQAPEVHMDEEYDAFLLDAFSVGVALYALLVRDYPWLSTRTGGCKCFEYVQKRGFRAYLLKRKIRGSPDPVINTLSPALVNLLEGLLCLDPAKRLTLGEKAWLGEDCVPTRRSVWDEEWLKEGTEASSLGGDGLQ